MATTTTKNSQHRVASKPFLPIASTVAAAAILASPAARTADWQIVPNLTVRGTYSDNIRLARQGLEESDFVSEVSPGLSIIGNGPNLQLQARYAFQQLNYANDSKGDSSFHTLDATTKVHLVKDLLSVDGMAAINQRDVELFGPSTFTSANYTVNPNRTTVRTATVSPYLHHRFRGLANGELRYTKSQVNTGSQSLSSSDIDAVALNITSDQSARTLAWGFRHDAQRTERPGTNSVDSKSTTANVRYIMTPQFALTASGGFESFDYIVAPGEPNPEGSFYSGGFSWRPNARTSIDWSVGKHFYGTTFMLNSALRGRHTMWRVTYDETVTNSTAQIALASTSSTADFLDELFQASIPDPVLRRQAVERLMASSGLPSTLDRTINYLTTQFFLQKALRASVAITGAKNSLVFTLSGNDRNAQSLATGASALGDTRQLGATALWSWRFSGRTNATFGADHVRKKLLSTNLQERLKTYRIGLAHQFQPRLSGVLELKHATSASDAGFNYQENAVSAYVSMQF